MQSQLPNFSRCADFSEPDSVHPSVISIQNSYSPPHEGQSDKGQSDAANDDLPRCLEPNKSEARPLNAESNGLSSKPPPDSIDRGRGKRGVGLFPRTAPTASQRPATDWSAEHLAELQRNDDDIADAVRWCEQGTRPPWEEVKSASAAIRALWQQYESLVLRNGVLHRIYHATDGTALYYQLVLSAELKTDFLELIHCDAACHLGYKKCVDHLQRRAWWPTWRRDLNVYVRCCGVCASYHRGKIPPKAKLHPIIMSEPAERFVLDLCGPFRPSNGYKYVLTAMCPFSKFVIAVPIRSKEAHVVARAIMDHIVTKWGLPLELQSDLGNEFQAELSLELFRLLGIDKIRSTAYRPKSQGGIERWHRVLRSLMAKNVSEKKSDWSSCLNYVTFCYNCTVHSAT